MFERGLALGGLGRWEEAADLLGDVIRRQRRAGREGAALRAVTEWTRIRWYAGHHEEALHPYAVAVELDPGEAMAYCNRGNSLMALGRYGEAVDAMLGPTGNLRAPTLKSGKTLLVGFNEDTYRAHLG